jgi:hypothetical protein
LHHPRTILLRLSLGITLVTWLNAVPQHPVESVQRRGEIELLSLHKQERKAHFGHDVQALLAHIGTQLLDIRDGRVSRDDVRNKFVEYFKHAQFSAWDDVEPPIVRVSADGKTGWMSVRIWIAYTDADESGREFGGSVDGSL